MFFTIPHTYKSTDFKALFSPFETDGWEEVGSNTHVFGVYGNAFIPDWGRRAHPEFFSEGRFMDDNDIGVMGDWLRSRDMKLGIATGGVKKWSPDAKKALKKAIRIFERLRDCGADPGYLLIDESLNAGRKLDMEPGATADYLASNFVLPLKDRYSNLRIAVVEPWPVCTASNLMRYVESLFRSGCTPDSFHLDIDFPQIRSDDGTGPVREMFSSLRSADVRCGIIAWSSNFNGRPKDNWSFCANTRDFSQWFHDEFGDLLDDHIVQSWLPYPARSLPESEEYTFMGLVRWYGRSFVPDWREPGIVT